jgi:cell shape-determining protein MreD
MSLIALIAGLPLPIINLIATLIFYLGNRKGTYFVRWHCTQALLSQLAMLAMNSVGFWWTISIIFGSEDVTNNYIAYMLTILIFNLIEFVITIRTAIETRKGNHIEWWFFGTLTNHICKPNR